MKLRKSNSKYDLSAYSLKCPVCGRISKNNKCFADHIFHRNWKGEKHKEFAKYLRKKSKEHFLKKAKKICPVCNKYFLRNLGGHFTLKKDGSHVKFYDNQKKLVIKYFLEYKSTYEIKNIEGIYLSNQWIYGYLNKVLGRQKFLCISKSIMAKKASKRWLKFSTEERKRRMQLVRDFEWKNLTSEQRKNHPWVVAGRKASLESGLRGSKNQKYAFELLKSKLPNFNWIYNYAINEDWQIDIASPEQKIFIEWDGRHHRIPIHGEGYLNNRKNRDYVKNKIVTEQLNGTMIRVNDGGRFNEKFVEEKVNEIVEWLNKNIEKSIVILI